VFRGKPTHFVHDKVTASRAKLSILSGSVGARFNGIRPSLALSLWQALIRPGLEWGCELISPPPTLMRQLNSILPGALRVFVGADTFTPNDALAAEFGVQSFASRHQELILRLFKRLATIDPHRALSRLFRARCDQVDHGVAPFSICQVFKSLLIRFDLGDVWFARPQDDKHQAWLKWNDRVHNLAVKIDLAERKSLILSRPSLSLFSKIKPLNVQCAASYLDRQCLGSWVKLKLRSGSLPLGDFLLRHSKLDLPPSQAFCRLCDLAVVEDSLHFVCDCPSLSGDRASLATALSTDSQFMSLAHDGASDLLDCWRSGSSLTRLSLALGSVENVCSGLSKRKKRTVSVLDLPFRCTSSLLARFEALCLPFLAKIWRHRASLLKGVPSLDIKGESIVLTQLREDGRCRFFAVGSTGSHSHSSPNASSSHVSNHTLHSVQSLDSRPAV
jgi:hypothetical protein